MKYILSYHSFDSLPRNITASIMDGKQAKRYVDANYRPKSLPLIPKTREGDYSEISPYLTPKSIQSHKVDNNAVDHSTKPADNTNDDN